MKRPFLALARDERGTSLIEFGFLVPFLALLTMGVIDLSRGLAERFAIQQAVSRGLELVQSRPALAAATASDVDYSFVKTEVGRAAGIKPAEVDQHVTVTRWLECNGVDAGDVNGTCPTNQDTARYLKVRVTKAFVGEFYLKTVPMAASGTLRTQ
ncbi:MAG TPA: TadE/TadG family type IV pilus assembly protein [Allosphingosinicella sp.]|nr:TadE/TadG family type IV pilus assembly protein [Allosphingosinicella sp.]